MPNYQARPFAIGDIGAGGLVYYDMSIGEPNLNYDEAPGNLKWFMGPDEIPGFIIAKQRNLSEHPTFFRSTDKTDASYLSLLRSLYKSMTGLEPKSTIPWFDKFLSINNMYTSYEVSGSMEFIGDENCYATISNAHDLFPNVNDFTVEWFQYQSAGSSFPRIFQFGEWPSGFGASFESGSLYFWYHENYIFRGLPTWENEWIHLAICRYKNYVRMFHNGTQMGEAVYIPDEIADTDDTMYIGIDPSYTSTTYFTGKISNLHFTPSMAKYWENFPVPTSGLNVSYNSRLLMRASTEESLMTDSSPLGLTVTNAGSTPITWSSDKPFV